MSSLLDDVKRLIAETCAIDRAKIRDDARLAEYGIDSVRAVDLLVALEDAFKIEIPDQDAARLVTVRDIVAYVEKKKRPA